MISKRRLALVVATILAGVTLGVGTASPAEAGLPLCRSVREVHGVFVPTSSSGGTSCLIGNGLVGCWDCSAIWALQVSLNHCNGQNIDEDGVWGPETRGALIDAQGDRGTTPDGIYGPNTRDAIKHAERNVSGPSDCHFF